MQHGSARPWAVKYINDPGPAAQRPGLAVVLLASGSSPGSVAPEALKRTPSSRASAFGLARSAALRSVDAARTARMRARAMPWPFGEIDEALQIHLRHVDLVRETHEMRAAARSSPSARSATARRAACSTPISLLQRAEARATLRTMRSNMSRPRTSAKARGSAASSETRNSSRPAVDQLAALLRRSATCRWC